MSGNFPSGWPLASSQRSVTQGRRYTASWRRRYTGDRISKWESEQSTPFSHALTLREPPPRCLCCFKALRNYTHSTGKLGAFLILLGKKFFIGNLIFRLLLLSRFPWLEEGDNGCLSDSSVPDGSVENLLSLPAS